MTSNTTSQATPAPAGFLDRRQIIMVAVLLIGAALSVLNQTSVSPMLPVIMNELSVTSPIAQWLVSGFSLVTAVVIPVSAYLMKRFSTRAVFFVSMAFFIGGRLLGTINRDDVVGHILDILAKP